MDKLHVYPVSNLCSPVGVFARLWADTSVPESSAARSMLEHVAYLRFIPMSVFLADSSLLFMSLCVNVQQNRKCLQSLWEGTQEWRFLFMREMKSAEGKREIKGRGWIQEHSLMWPRLYCWCSGLSLFTTSCSKSAWIWLKEGFFTNAVNSWKDVWLSDQLKQGAGPCLFTDIY